MLCHNPATPCNPVPTHVSGIILYRQLVNLYATSFLMTCSLGPSCLTEGQRVFHDAGHVV